MIDLKDITFIIPVRIESPDREANARITLNYLCTHLNTNIIILEHDSSPKMPEILKDIKQGRTKIEYRFIDNKEGTEIFHRTKFLNIMLDIVETPVVVNYDVDVLLRPEVYKQCRDLIVNDRMDLVYPYFWGTSQYQVYYPGRDRVAASLSLDSLIPGDYNLNRSEYGHCQFFNTLSYRKGGMENEGFISYAPEDQERGYRFQKLGYKVMWNHAYVYHLEHTRGINSSSANPMMNVNNQLFEDIKRMSEQELALYYRNVEYLKQYRR